MGTQAERRAHARAAAIVARIPPAEAAGEMAAQMESHVAAFERISERSHGEILAGLQRSLARWTRFLLTGTMPPDRSFDPLREWARARAAEGVRLEDLLRSFALAHQLGWQLLRRHARSDESDALLELAGLLAEYHDQVSAVVTETYLGERELLGLRGRARRTEPARATTWGGALGHLRAGARRAARGPARRRIQAIRRS